MDYRNFLNELNSCNLGYRRPECFGMNLLCGYYSIDHSQYERLKRMGELLCGIFKKIYGLYGDAILNNNEEVLNLFETGTLRSKVMRRLHRQMFVRGSGNLPLIFRMDSPDGEHCVDCHVGFRGMGYIYALRNVAQRYYGVDAFFNNKRQESFVCKLSEFFKSTGGEITLYMRERQHQEVCYFWEQMFGPHGFSKYLRRHTLSLCKHLNSFRCRQIHVSSRDFYDSIKFKNTPLAFGLWFQKVVLNDKYDAVLRYLKANADIEPPPILLYEQKIIPAIMYHQRYRDYFSEEERRLFPETYIISKGMRMEFAGNKYSLDDIVNLPAKKRSFIVKYAAMDLNLDWGGQAVYRIKTNSKRWPALLFKKALDSYERNKDPWIIQKDISQKEDIQYFKSSDSSIQKSKYYKLLRPYFIKLPGQDLVEVIDELVLFNGTFKVHAQSNCAVGLVSLRKDEN